MIPIKDDRYLDSLRSIIVGMTTFIALYGIYYLASNPKLCLGLIAFICALFLCWTLGEVIRGIFQKEEVTRDTYYRKEF